MRGDPAATDEDLLAHGRRWLDEMLRHGVTTIEAKSGYGLDLPTELRLLEVAHGSGAEGPIDVVPTFLGAHAVPPEFRARPDGTEAYVRTCHRGAAARRRGPGPRALSCDVFCEEGVFTRRPEPPDPHRGGGLRDGASASTPTSSPRPVARSSPRSSARSSADHLATPSDAGIAALAAAAETDDPIVATLLPGTTWFLMKDHHAPARPFIDARRPGGARHGLQSRARRPTPNLPLVMTVACLELRLSPDEALVAVTINAAHAARHRRRARVARARQGGATSSIWRVPTDGADPVLGGRGPRPDASSSAGGSSSTGREPDGAWSDLLAARLEQDGRRLGRQARGLIDSLGWIDGSAPISWKNFCERLGAVGLVLADRHRHDDPRVQLGDERGGAGRR